MTLGGDRILTHTHIFINLGSAVFKKFLRSLESNSLFKKNFYWSIVDLQFCISFRCGGGRGNPLQYFCLENSMDRGAWQAAVHGVAKSWSDTTEQILLHSLHFRCIAQ